jgi:hypothetical protein
VANTPSPTTPFKTRQLCESLDVSHDVIMNALRRRKIQPPAKDCSGDYIWGPEDIAAARAALAVDRRYGPRARKAVRA